MTYNQAKDGYRGGADEVVHEFSCRLEMAWSVGPLKYKGVLRDGSDYRRAQFSVTHLVSENWEEDVIAAAEKAAQEQAEAARIAREAERLAEEKAWQDATADMREDVIDAIKSWLRDVGVDPAGVLITVPGIPRSRGNLTSVLHDNTWIPCLAGPVQVMLRFNDHQFRVDADVAPDDIGLTPDIRIAPEFPGERWRPADTALDIGEALREERRLRGAA